MQPILVSLRARAHAATAHLPAPYRVPALAGAAALALLVLAAGFRGLLGRAPPAPLRPRDAAADALYRRATVSHVLGAPAGAGGPLEFLRYTPAPLEQAWAAQAPALAGRECAQIIDERAQWQAQLDGVRASGAGSGASSGRAVGGAKGGASDAAGSATAAAVAPTDTWSYVTYRNVATGAEVSVALEPLAGMMRDPRPICDSLHLSPRKAERHLDSRDFTLLDPAFYAAVAAQLAHPPAAPAGSAGVAADATSARPRALLFDLGATRWDPKYVTGFRWTVETFERLGVSFDAIFAWEAVPIATADFFGPMPLRLASRTHLYNVPVARPGAGGVADALSVLREVARPQDFVVFKLDIDTDVLEEEIALALLQDDALAARVDVFFFEHHSDTHGVMNPSWGDDLRRSLHESILLFQAFRKRGILAHSWP
jgi:hypothetical protein